MRGLIFWVEGPVGMDQELWQEPLRLLCEALSETSPLWLLRWHWNDTTPTYEMDIWDGRGREVTFWGAWKTKEIFRHLTHYWHLEDFTPTIIVKVFSWSSHPLLYWKKRLRIPVVELFSGEGIRNWPHSGLRQEPVSGAKRLLIPVDPGSADAAYDVGSALIEKGWSILFTGWARTVTPFRRLHSRHPERVSIHLGLSWLEVESLLDTCRAVVLPAPRPLLLALGWGMPVFYPGTAPWRSEEVYTYNDLEELSTLAKGANLSTTLQKTAPEIASDCIKWWEALSTGLST